MCTVAPTRWDEDLIEACLDRGEGGVRVWEPRSVYVVLGRGNRPEQEVHLDRCARDAVPVLRRRGGGGAVVLAPGCLVLSLARPLPDPLRAGERMARTVVLLAEVLERITGLDLAPRGTGDLCRGERKVLGSSAFARRGVFFYQASLLVSMDLGLVDRYLRHPSREPAYRKGRPHRAFLTTLAEAGSPLGARALGAALERAVGERLPEIA